MRVVVLGRQGAGKGTQCALLAVRLGVAHVSTGDVFRAAVKTGTELGNHVRAFVEAGELVPDDLAVAVVAQRLEHETGFVLDGFPRTVPQAQQLVALIAPAKIDAADIRVDSDVALRRLLGRRVCVDCGHIQAALPNAHSVSTCSRCNGTLARRSDDTDPLIHRRLALYEAQTRPLLSWLAAQRMLRTVDGQGLVEVVARRVEDALSSGAVEEEGRWSLARLARGVDPRARNSVFGARGTIDAGAAG